MKMTLEQYILNPMGKNNAVLNSIARENIRKTYIRKFDNILLRENGRIEYHLYKDASSNTYWAHIKVPSEVVKKFYYDVIFKFTPSESTDLLGSNLFKYNVKFYSNDPAFVYTYANVFYKNNLFIKELSPKMSREALRKAAKEKNPSGDVGYVKSLYFAYLLMQNRKLNNKIKFDAEATVLNLPNLINSVEDADTKIRKRQEEGAKVSRRKKIELDEKTAKRFMKNLSSNANTDRIQIGTTKKVSTIKNKSTTKSVKTTKRK